MSKLDKLFKALVETKNIPHDLKLLLITDTQILVVYEGRVITIILSNQKDSIYKSLKFSRDAILSFFSKIEFLINELIRLKLSTYEGPEGSMLDDLLTRINLKLKLDLLKRWDIIKGNYKRKLDKLIQVRNSFAHVWDEKVIKYKNQLLRNNFISFKEDAVETWSQLVEVYKSEQRKINIDKIIKRLNS